MKTKRTYLQPRCIHTRVVLEEGLCATSGDNIDNVEVKSGSPLEVTDYASIGGENGFNDITFD